MKRFTPLGFAPFSFARFAFIPLFFRIQGLVGGIGLALMVSACRPADPHATLSGDWQLTHFQATASDWISLPPPHLDQPVWMSCKDNGRRGHFSGATLTNHFTGTYTLSPDGSMVVTAFGTGYLGEPEWSAHLREALPAAHGYQVGSRTLIIAYGDEGRSMHFVPYDVAAPR